MNLLENINLVSPSFKGKDYTDLSYKPEVLPENERSHSVPSQLFGNCTIFNLQYSLKFMFDWNESKLTHFIHDSLVRYNSFLNQKVDMTYANYNKKESSSSKGGCSVVTEEHQVQEERILAYKERVLIQREEQRTRANSI